MPALVWVIAGLTIGWLLQRFVGKQLEKKQIPVKKDGEEEAELLERRIRR